MLYKLHPPDNLSVKWTSRKQDITREIPKTFSNITEVSSTACMHATCLKEGSKIFTRLFSKITNFQPNWEITSKNGFRLFPNFTDERLHMYHTENVSVVQTLHIPQFTTRFWYESIQNNIKTIFQRIWFFSIASLIMFLFITWWHKLRHLRRFRQVKLYDHNHSMSALRYYYFEAEFVFLSACG